MSKRNKAWVIVGQLTIAILGLTVWQLVVDAGLVNKLFMAGPIDVARRLALMATDGTLASYSLETLKVAGIGFALGMLVGSTIGFVLGVTPLASAMLSPYITVFNSLPRIALAPLFVLWFGIGSMTAVVLVFSLVVFIFLTATLTGAQSVDRNQIVLARMVGASGAQTIMKVVLPSTLPWIVAAARLSIAYALGGAVVAEMFAGQGGLGFLIVAGSGTFDITAIFASVVVILIAAWFLDAAANAFERRFLGWKPRISL